MPQDEEGKLTPTEPGLVGLPQRVHKASREDLLKGLLDPLAIENPVKADIWDRVLGQGYSNADLQQYLDPLDIDRTTKADIWDIRTGLTGHLPAAAIPKAEPPAPEAPAAEIPAPPTGLGELPTAPDRVGVGPLGPRVPAAFPPEGQVPYEVAKSREERAGLEPITPILESGFSPSMRVGGQLGHFNFDADPIKDERTPGTRYAFDTESGRRFYYQLEQAYQGGRWEDAAHAAQDFEGYKQIGPEERTRLLGLQWDDQKIAETIDRAAAANKSFDELKDDLRPFNTYRQISTDAPEGFRRFPLPPGVTTPKATPEEIRLGYLEFQGAESRTVADEAEMEKLKQDIKDRTGKIDIWETFGDIFTKRGIGVRTPFVGGWWEAGDAYNLLLAAQRVEAGTATEAQWQRLVDWDTEQKSRQYRGSTWWADVVDMASFIPGFAVEFITTGGVYNTAKKITLEGLQAFMRNAAQKAVTRSLRRRAAAIAAGGVAQSLALGISTRRIRRGQFERMTPEFTVQGNDLLFLDEGDDFFPALIKSVGDNFIEIMSERAGGALAHLPGGAQIRRLKEAVAARWLRLNPNKTLDDLLIMVRDQAGWHGPLGEIFEERVGEEARRFTGLGEGQPTVIGQFLTGESKEAWRQLLTEAAAFTIPGAAAATLRSLSGGPVMPPPDRPLTAADIPPPPRPPGPPGGPPGAPPPPAAPEVETLPPEGAPPTRPITPEEAAEQVGPEVEDRKRRQFSTTVMEVNGQFQSQVTDGFADDRFTSPIVATEEEARQLANDWMKEEAERILAGVQTSVPEAQALEEEQQKEREKQARTERFTEKWGPLPTEIANRIAGDLPLNPKVEELVYAINSRGVKTTLSGDLFEGRGLEGKQVVYVDIDQEDVDRINKAALPEGWSLIPSITPGVREYLGLPIAEADFDIEAQEEMLAEWRKAYKDNRLIRQGTDPVSPQDIDLLLRAMEEPAGPPPDAAYGMSPEERGIVVESATERGIPGDEWGVFRVDPTTGQRSVMRQFKDLAEAEAWAETQRPGPEVAAVAEADKLLATMEAEGASEDEIRYAMDYRDYLFAEGEDPGTRGGTFPIDLSGPIRMQLEEIGTRFGIARPGIPTELPPTPEAAPMEFEVDELTPEDQKWKDNYLALIDQLDESEPKDDLKQYTDQYFDWKAGINLIRPGLTMLAPEQVVQIETDVDKYFNDKIIEEVTGEPTPPRVEPMIDDVLEPEIPTLEELAGTLQEILESAEVTDIGELPEIAEENAPVQEFWTRNANRYQRLQDFYNSIDEKNYPGKKNKAQARKLLDTANAAIAEIEKQVALVGGAPERLAERRAKAFKKELDGFPVGTTFELELEDIPEGIEEKDEWTGSWEKIRRKMGTGIVWINSEAAPGVKPTRTSSEFAKAQRESGGRFMIRPERPSSNIVEEPEETPPVRELSPYAEDQRETNPGFLAPVETGQRFAARMIQGRGATLEVIYGPEAVKEGRASPVAGAAQYYSFTEEHARRYGDEISTHEIQLDNPIVIDNDRQWSDLLIKANAQALHSVDQPFRTPELMAEIPEAARRFQNYLRALGHDGIIVKVPDPNIGDNSPYGENAKRLRETWRESQVVVFYENAPMSVAELKDAVLARTDIPEEQVDAWIELLKSHAEGMGMTLQTWVDSRIARVEGLPSLRRKDGTLPPGALDTLLYQRRSPLTEAQFMSVWNEVYPELKAERLKTVAEDAVEDEMNDFFMKAWGLRGNFFDKDQLRDWFRVSNAPLKRRYGDKVTVFRAPDIEAVGASLIAKPQKGPRAFKGWKKLLIAELGPDVDLSGIDLNKLYRRSKVIYARTLRATVAGKLPSAKTLGRLYDKGEANKHWFDKFWEEIQIVFGEEAELVANLAASHSQMTDTTQNAERTLQAYIELKTGVPFTATGPAKKLILANLNRVAQGKPIKGIKVTNFLKNLMGDLSAVTLDRHMMGIFFGDKNKAPTERQAELVTKIVTKAAQQVGVMPAQYQSALWAAVRKASEERAAPLERIMWRLLREDPRFAGLREDLIKNAADPDAVRSLIGAAAAENESKRIPEPPETVPVVTVGFGLDRDTVLSVANRMEITPSEDVVTSALNRANTFLDEQHLEDWFGAQGIIGPDRIKASAAAKVRAVERQKFFKGMKAQPVKERFVFGRKRPAPTGEENLLEAIRGPQEAPETLRDDPELKERRTAQQRSQEHQPPLPLSRDVEDEYLTALVSDMFAMDKAPVQQEVVRRLEIQLAPLKGMKLKEAITYVLQNAERALTGPDILSRLHSGGFYAKKPDQRVRQIFTITLNRMKPELETEKVKGKILYLPLPPPDILFQRTNPLTQAEFMAVWEEQAHYLRVVAREITQNDDAAQDLRQEVFAKAWTRIDRFADKTHAKNWLGLTTRRAAIDWLRKYRKVPARAKLKGAEAFVPGPNTVDLPKFERQLFLEEIRQVVQPVIDGLPQHQKEALLSMFDEASAVQTAKEMGLDVNTLRSRRRVAFKKIEAALADVDLERDNLFQRGESRHAKGAVQFLREGRAILHVLEASDVATLIHESAHIFRQDLNAADTAILEDWQEIKDGKWTVQNEENVARAMERYLREGVVPEGQPKLRALFEKFKAWLTGIYETITGSAIDIQIPDSVRPVLARMLGITEVPQERPAEEPAIPPTPAEVEAGVPDITDLRSPFRTVASVILQRPVPERKAPFVAAVQHRRILEDFPANQTVRVMDGLAYSTNGNVSLITRSDLKDGQYSPYVKGQPKAFKKLKEDEDLWFPEVGASEEDGRFTIRAVGDLRRAWRNIRTAEESRLVLSSVQLEIEGSEDPLEGAQYATIRSTDGHRAALNTVPFTSGSAKPGTYLIPRKAIELILKDKKAEEIEVLIGDGSITMITDHIAVSSLPVEGEYPKFDRLMPDPERQLHVDKEGLLRALKTLKAEMDPKEPGVYFWMHDEGTLEMGVLKEIKEGEPDTFTTSIVFTETSPDRTASPTNITILMPRRKDLKENSDFSLDLFYLKDIVEGVAGDDVLFGVPKNAEGIFGFAGSQTAARPSALDVPIEELPTPAFGPGAEFGELPPTPEEEARSPHMNLAYALLRDLKEGAKINNPRLTALANDAFGGTRGEGAYNPRDSYDAMEVALNLYIEDEEMIDFADPEATTKRLRAVHALMPAQIDRTEEGIEFQQFSSPPDLAFAAAYASASANTDPVLVALEPSAGTGSIAIMLDAGGSDVIVNEKAPRRAQLLRDQEFDNVFEVDAEFLHSDLPENIQPDVIVMNPPFSATGGRTKAHATKYGAKHVTEALARLNEGGRLVAIVGQGMAMDRPAFRDWWNRVMMKHTVRANIGIAGKHYRKWGTSFGQQLIVIDKTGPHDLVTVPLAEKLKTVIMGKELSPQEAIRLLRPLAEEDISERVYQRPTETGVPPTPTELRRGREEAPGPPTPPGGVLPERGPERGYQPEAGPPGRAEPEELGRVEPGEGELPEAVQPGRREGPGVGEPGGPVEPGRAPGVGGVPGPGDIRPTEPVTGVEEGFGSRNTVFTKEDADEARELIRKRIRDLGQELEMGMPPELLRAYFKLGGFYFEGGLREFGPWSRKMIEDLGEAARPVLQSVFDTVKGFYEAKEQEDAAKFTKERRQSVIEEENPYSPYSVTKHIFEGAQPHPANIVESSYLATVETPEPPVEGDEGYMKLPQEVITEGRLSDLQAEAVQIMLQRWATLFPDGTRPGFWLGDGTGLGKGREIGAAIWDNWISGRKRAVWFSTNHKLIADATRDLRDLGAPMPLIAHQDVKTKGTIPDRDGVLFTAYSFPSYHIRSDAPRFHQLTEWLGPDFDGVIAFDESHLLKNAIMGGRSGQGAEEGTQRGRMAALLEEMYPKARFVYVSATGATVPRNMGYMTRLGLWGPGLPFSTFPDFLQAMARGGMGAMEMLSRDLKAIGAFIARTISYQGVEYENVEHNLTPMEVDQYNNIADLWSDLLNEFEEAIDNANQPNTNQFNAFYNAQQRFFLLVMASLKLPTLYTEVAKDLAAKRSVIINLFNTNEGQVTRMVNQARADGIDLAELDFTPRQIIAELIERHFPIYEYIEEWDPVSQENVKVIREDEDGNPVPNRENLEKQEELLARLSDISFPENPLDAIVNHFGPENVAEISGRKMRMEGDDQVRRKIEGVPAKKIDLKEIERFQDGEVRIAIITGSAATGISLHSDLSRKNQQRRVFYAFQLNWSADVQLQSFGRAHRSSQAEPPIYRLLRTNLSAEERLVNATARRLASLGALTTGSREALGGNLFTIEDLTDVYGEAAVQVTYRDIYEGSIEGIAGGPSLLRQMGMADADGNVKQRNNADTNVNRFLNRIMALHVDVQNIVFKQFYDHYQRIVLQAQQDGTYDMGIQPIRDRNWNKAQRITLKGEREVIYTHPNSGAETQLIELIAEFPVRTVSFENSKRLGRGSWNINKKSGKIYFSSPTDRTKFVPGLKAKDPRLQPEQPIWVLTNPKGISHDVPEYQLDPRFNFDKLDEQIPAEAAEAERMWNAELEALPEFKEETIDILTGAVMPIYDKVVGLGKNAMTNLRIVRAILEDGTSYIGMRIQPNQLGPLRQRLGIGTPLGEATPAEIYKMVLENGALIELDNLWRIKRTKVHGEQRVELDPRGKYNRDEMKVYDGVYEERLDYKRRFFIPIDETEGPKAVAQILDLHKAVRDILAESEDPGDLEGPSAGMPSVGMPELGSVEPDLTPGELPGSYPLPDVTGVRIPPTPGAEEPGAARTRLWAEGVPEGAVVYRPKKPEYMPGMPFGSRRLQRDWVDPVTGVRWPAQSVPWIKVRVGQPGGVFPEQIPVDDPLRQQAPDPIYAMDMDYEMVMPLVNQWEGEDPGKVVDKPEVINSLIKIVEAAGKTIPIRTGRIGKRAEGTFKIMVEVIRLAKALHIPAATHEIAHALEKAIYGWEKGGPWIFRTHSQRKDLMKLGTDLYGVPGEPLAKRPNYGYMREGWAEFMRIYLTGEEGDAQQRAPHLYKWFMEEFMVQHAEVSEAIETARRVITKYRLQGSDARVQAQMPEKAPHTSMVVSMVKAINYMNWIEALAPIERLENYAIKMRGPDNPLPIVKRPFLVSSSLRNLGPVTVHGWMLRSMTDIAGNAVGRPLKDIVNLIKATKIPHVQAKFMWFMYALRARERWNRKTARHPEGMNPGISLADAEAYIEHWGNDQFWLAADWFQEWNLGVLNYAMQGGLITERTLNRIMQGSTDYAGLARIFDDVSPEFFQKFERMTRGGARSPFPYFYGAGERVKSIWTTAIERATRIVGQTHQRIVIDLMVKLEYAAPGMGIKIEEVPRDKTTFNLTILRALEALAKESVTEEQEELIEELREKFAEEEIEETEAGRPRTMLEQVLNFYVPAHHPKGADPIVPIFDVQSQRMKWYRVDGQLYESLTMMDPFRLRPEWDFFFGTTTRAFRMTTTALRPTFAWWRNLVKDPQTWVMQTQTNANALKMAKTWTVMLADITFRGRKSPWFQQALRLGIEVSTPVGQDIRQIERAVKALFRGKVNEVALSPVDFARDWLSVPEYTTRAAEMKLMAQEFDKDPDNPGMGSWYPGDRPLTFEEATRLRLGIKRATVDFSAAGRVGRKANQVMPFFNPQLQGMRQFLRVLTPEERKRIEGELVEVKLLTGKPFSKIAKGRIRRSFLWGTAVFVLPTLALWWGVPWLGIPGNKDEEWYKAMPWWEKFTYWNIGTATKIWQIPRAHEYGPFFSAMTEAIFDAAYRENPEAMKQVMGQILRVGNPFSFPPPMQFAVEEWGNIDLWTGAPIIPQREEVFPPGMQRGRYTSKLAIMIGEMFPRHWWASPRRIDHAIRSFFGGLGPDLLQMVGLGVGPGIVSRIGYSFAPHDTEEQEPLPTIGYLAFAQRAGGLTGIRDRFVDDFYEEWARVDGNYRYRRAAQIPLGQAVSEEYPIESMQELHWRNLLTDARYAMSLLNRMARDPSITEEQLQQIKIMQRQISYDVMQKKELQEIEPTPEERAAIEAGYQDLTLDEQYALVERLYIESQVIDNDPASFWPKVQAMGLNPRRVSNMLNSTRLEIALLQISKAMIPVSNRAEIDNIELRIKQLEQRRAMERFQGTSRESRFGPRSVTPPGVIPGIPEPPPSVDILNPRDPRAP